MRLEQQTGRADFLCIAANIGLTWEELTDEERHERIKNKTYRRRSDYIRDLRRCSGQDGIAEEDLQGFLLGCKG